MSDDADDERVAVCCKQNSDRNDYRRCNATKEDEPALPSRGAGSDQRQ
jgi:hypothetical protein